MTNKPDQKVFRFGLGYRLAHWNNGIFFLALLLTGLSLVFKGASGLIGDSTILWVDRIHRLAAWPYTILTIPILVLTAGKETREWLRGLVTWDADDWAFLRAFPKALFNRNHKLPPQGKFNAGEKINSLLTIVGTFVMMITGWALVLQDRLGEGVMRWALPIHSATAMLMGGVILGHMWLSLVHPDNRKAMPGMVSGYVSKEFAQEHHEKWYQKVKGA